MRAVVQHLPLDLGKFLASRKFGPLKAGMPPIHRAVEHRHQNATVTPRLALELPKTLDVSNARHLGGPPAPDYYGFALVWRREADRLLGAHPGEREIVFFHGLCVHPCERKAAPARADGVAANKRRLDGRRHRPGRARVNTRNRYDLTG